MLCDGHSKLAREPGVVFDEPVDHGEQETHRKPAHKHTDDTLHWPQHPPYVRQNDITISDSRIAAR